MRALILTVLLVAACGKSESKPKAPECRAACEHTHQLAVDDIHRSMKEVGDPEMLAKLLATVEESRESDLQTCIDHCLAGRLDPKCAQAALLLDEAMACTRK
jgi:hypothetical protein